MRYLSRERRVVGKAEHLEKGPNPRFLVTSITAEEVDAKTLYEVPYCARGDMENRIKEQPLDLFADCTSTEKMRSNHIRVYFSAMAYWVFESLRRLGLKGAAMAKARCGTIREKLLKIGAQIQVAVRKIWVSLAERYPYRNLFAQVFANPEVVESGS